MKFLYSRMILIILISLFIVACKNSDEKIKQPESNNNTTIISSTPINFFPFLTGWFGKTGVYKYDLAKRKYSPVWWHPRENVVLLIFKPGNHPVYFLTASKIGIKGNFPFFSGLKLFRIEKDLSESKQIDKIGSGLQFTVRWDEDENLEVIFTGIDNTTPAYVNQYTKVYDYYGKLVDSEIKTFDVEKNGFPQLLPERNPTVSPSGKYGVSFKGDSVFLKRATTDTMKFITVINHSLNKVVWSEDEKFLVFSTMDLNNKTINTRNPETSELFIYSLVQDSLVVSFSGAGVKSFFTSGNFLVFDDGFGKNSVINIYDLKLRKVVDIVKPREGCGLRNLPMLPSR